MPKVEFIVDHKVQQHDGKGPEYKAGQVYDLHISYAEKYKRLGKAVDYVARKASASADKTKSPQRRPGDTESVEVRQDIDGDKRTLYVVKPWPKFTKIAEEMLTEPDSALQVNDGHVTITVANGFAIYKLGDEVGAGYRECALVDSKYEPAPEKK